MKTKVRLLFTNDCNRRCKGCCNKNWTGEPPVEMSIEEVRSFDEIYITGGEPMLYPEALLVLIKMLRTDSNKIFLYTAMPYPRNLFISVMQELDGASITLHDDRDVQRFVLSNYHKTSFNNKSMRVNDFTKTDIPFSTHTNYDYREMTWITDAPLPEGEVFAKLK